MYDNLKYTITNLRMSKKIKCFFLGNTAKKERSSFYISDIRENQKFIYATAIIYNGNCTRKIAKIIDGKVDYILVDAEKKIISKNKKAIVNIEKSAKNSIKKSEIFTYKGNDLTVQAADTFINDYFIKDIRGIGGKKILILGAGNIGFKLGLKMVENGGNVYLYRRSKKILNNIIRSINFIKPKGTKATAKKLNRIDNNLKDFDIIFGCTDGKSILTKNHVEKFKKDVVILDIGKGILQKNALKLAISNKINLFRLDITPAYNSFLENMISIKKLNNLNLMKTKKYGNICLAKKGVLTESNTIIVDNLNNPRKVYGISDGYGSFKKVKLNELKLIEKKIKLLKKK